LIKKKSDVSNNVTLEQFVEYFKNLNELSENEKNQEIDFDSVDRENVHNILNSPITEEEFLRVVKNFKSNKASGYDNIVNEHIKSTITFLSHGWDSEIKPTSSDNSHNLSFRTEIQVLLRHDTNVICLYDLGSLVSPLFL
jgi:hypothetical protein